MHKQELSLQEIQAVSLEILKKVASICEEQKLTYYLAYGTLIGAIRHKGFIPWDDDIDIMMPRKDYIKLIDFFQAHKSQVKPLELFSIYNNSEYPYMISRISNSNYVLDVDNEKPYGIGVFIDIYPMDGVGNTEEEVAARKQKATRYSSLCYLSTRIRCEKGNTKSRLKLAIKLPAFLYAKATGKTRYIKKLEAMAQEQTYDACKYVGCLVWGSDGVKGIFPKEWFAEGVQVEFETGCFKAPRNFDAVLSRLYGNYMELPPEKDRIGHHFYRAYRK